jgi:hypothetical protein
MNCRMAVLSEGVVPATGWEALRAKARLAKGKGIDQGAALSTGQLHGPQLRVAQLVEPCQWEQVTMEPQHRLMDASMHPRFMSGTQSRVIEAQAIEAQCPKGRGAKERESQASPSLSLPSFLPDSFPIQAKPPSALPSPSRHAVWGRLFFEACLSPPASLPAWADALGAQLAAQWPLAHPALLLLDLVCSAGNQVKVDDPVGGPLLLINRGLRQLGRLMPSCPGSLVHTSRCGAIHT